MCEPFLYKNLNTGKAGITSLAFNSQDILVSASSDNTVTLWNLKSLEKTKKLSTHLNQITRIIFSRTNPKTCVTASEDNTIKIWNDIYSEEFITLHGHNTAVTALAFSDSGDYLYSGDDDGKVFVWKLGKTPDYIMLAKESYRITDIQVSRDSSILIYGLSNGQLKFTNLIKQTVYCVFDGPKEGVSLTCLGLHPEQIVVAAGYSDGFIRVFDLTNREMMFEYKAHQGRVNSLAFQPQKRYLVSIGDDALIQIRDLKSGKTEYSLQAHNNRVLSLDFHENGNTFASGDLDGNIAIWKIDKDEMVATALPNNQVNSGHEVKEEFGYSDTLDSKLVTIDIILARIMDSLDLMHRMTDQNTRQLKYVSDYVDLQKS